MDCPHSTASRQAGKSVFQPPFAVCYPVKSRVHRKLPDWSGLQPLRRLDVRLPARHAVGPRREMATGCLVDVFQHRLPDDLVNGGQPIENELQSGFTQRGHSLLTSDVAEVVGRGFSGNAVADFVRDHH